MSRFSSLLFSLSWLLTLIQPVYGHDTVPHLQTKQHAKNRLSDIIAILETSSDIALIVQNIQGKVLFSHNPHKKLMPASTQKIITAIVAKRLLPEKSPFATRLLGKKAIKKGIHIGNLIVHGQGDPSFNQHKLQSLFNALRKKRIHTIQGDIVLNTHDFDDQIFTPGTFWEEINDCYAGPTSSLSIDGNCFTIELNYDKKGRKTKVTSPFPQQNITTDFIYKTICTHEKESTNHFTIFHKGAAVYHSPFSTPQKLAGCWSPNHAHESLNVSIVAPPQAFAESIKHVLAQQGVRLAGRIRIQPLAQIPLGYTIYHTEASDDLSEIIKKMLTTSDNHIANHLFKRIDKHQSSNYHQRAGWAHASDTYHKQLRTLGIHSHGISIADGAGLSRNNRLDAHFLQSALFALLKHQSLSPLIQLFPTNRNQDLLKKRFSSLHRTLFAKTGTLKSTSALAGYLDPLQKDGKVFTLIAQGDKNTPVSLKALELELMQIVEAL